MHKRESIIPSFDRILECWNVSEMSSKGKAHPPDSFTQRCNEYINIYTFIYNIYIDITLYIIKYYMNTLIKALAQAMNFSSLSTLTAPHWVKGSGLGGFQLVQFARYLGFKSEAEIPELQVEMLADCWKAASCTWAFHIVSVLRLLLFLPYIPSFQESDSLATSIHIRRIGAIQMLFLVCKQKSLHSCIFCKKNNPAVPPNRCQESPSCRVAKIFGEARENRT